MYMPGKNNCITGIIAYRVVVPIFYDFATLNNNLEAVPQFITDTTGRITGYKTPGGADTVFPFSFANGFKTLATAGNILMQSQADTISKTVTIDTNGICVAVTMNQVGGSTVCKLNGKEVSPKVSVGILSKYVASFKLYMFSVNKGDTVYVSDNMPANIGYAHSMFIGLAY